MKKRGILLLGILCAFLFSFQPLCLSQESIYPKLVDIRCQNTQTGSTVFIELDRFSIFVPSSPASEPPTIVLMPTEKIYSELIGDFNFEEDKGLVKRATIVKDPKKPVVIGGQFYNAIDFINIELKKGATARLSKDQNTLIVSIGQAGRSQETETAKKEIPEEKKEKPARRPKKAPAPAQVNKPAAQPQDLTIKSIGIDNNERDASINIQTSSFVRFMSFAGDSPRQIVFDPVGDIYSKLKKDYYFDDGLIESVKIIPKDEKAPEALGESYYPIDLILAQFREATGCEVVHASNGLIINAKGVARKKETTKQEVIEQEIKKQEEEKQETKQEVKQETKQEEKIKITAVKEEDLIKAQEQKDQQQEQKDPAAAEEPALLSGMEKIDKDENAAISFIVSRYSPVVYYSMTGPPQIVVDPVADIYTDLPKQVYYDQGIVESVKIIPKDGPAPEGMGPSFYAIDFISIALKKDKKFTVLQSGEELNVVIGDVKKTLLAVEPPAPKVQAKEFVKPAQEKDFGEIAGETVTFEDCFNTALANYLPAKVAIEEIKLAQMKVREAHRALYPNITIRATHTTGDVYQVGFTEKRYGVQIEQPIYYSGKLWNTFKQSKVNYQVARHKFEKVKSELAAKVAEAYYNLAAAQENLLVQKDLINKVEALLETSRKANSKELVTQVEHLTAESHYNQVSYQLESAKKDFELARLSLQNTMGLDSAIAIKAKPLIGFKYVNVQLHESLEEAYAMRQELIINALMVKVSAYEEKIARAKDGFKIDLTGFYGKSGSAYEGETLTMQTDYSIGVQASHGFWGNTLNYSYNKDKTAPRLGETQRTRSETHNAEFGVLNNLAASSDIQAARVGLIKAKADFVEMRQNVEYEVKDAYYNCEKSVIQLRNIANKVEIRQKELKISEIQTGLREAPLSSLMESWIKLTDERTLYNTTLSGYYIAVAKLNKAIGVIDYYPLPQ